MKREILNCLTYMANRAAEPVAHVDCWGANFCEREVKEA